MKLLNPATPPHTVSASRLKAVILDWAGTTVDFGSLAPARTLQTVFAGVGIALTEAETREDMGLAKRTHIRNLLKMARVAERWRTVHGAAPGEMDAERMYAEFIPLQFSCLEEYSNVIEGIPEAMEMFRVRGLRVGSTTGYTREMLDVLVALAAKQGYSPECSLTPGEVGLGRPYPFMIYENAVRLGVYPMAAIAKVGDTPSDIQEGLNAGTWAIGVAGTGNGIGLSKSEFEALAPAERETRLAAARAELAAAGAHFVVDAVTEVFPVLDRIDELLSGATPDGMRA